jgi:hypothetical protein
MKNQEQFRGVGIDTDLRPECLMGGHGMLRISHTEVVQ